MTVSFTLCLEQETRCFRGLLEKEANCCLGKVFNMPLTHKTPFSSLNKGKFTLLNPDTYEFHRFLITKLPIE